MREPPPVTASTVLDTRTKAGTRAGLAAWLALAFSALSVVLTASLLFGVSREVSDTVHAESSQRLADLAGQAVDKLDRTLYERYREVRSLSWRPELRAADTGAVRRLLDHTQSSHEHYAWMGWISAEGKVLAGTGRLLEGRNLANRPWFQAALRAKFSGDVHDAVLLAGLLAKTGTEPPRVIDLAFPVYDADGNLAGVLAAHIAWEWASEVAGSLSTAADRIDARLLIASRSGEILMGPRELLRQAVQPPLPPDDDRPPQGAYAANAADGTAWLTGYARSAGHRDFPGFGWTVLVQQPLEVALAPVARLRKVIALIGLSMAALFSIVGILFARRIAAPLVQLANWSRSVSRGGVSPALHDDERIPGAYREIEHLAGSVRTMVKGLQGSERKLQTLAQKEELLREDERQQVVRRLHDDVAVPLASARALIGHGSKQASGHAAAFYDAEKTIDSALGSLRELMEELRPSVLDQLGLWAAIEWYLDRWRQRTGVECNWDCEADLDALPIARDQATGVFRLVQQVLAASKPSTADMLLRARTTPQGLILRFFGGDWQEDDAFAGKVSVEIFNLEERVRRLGGEMRILREEDGRQLLVVSLPLARA